MKTKPKYRRLSKGDIIHDGDEWMDMLGMWHPTSFVGKRASQSGVYRRKVKAKP